MKVTGGKKLNKRKLIIIKEETIDHGKSDRLLMKVPGTIQ